MRKRKKYLISFIILGFILLFSFNNNARVMEINIKNIINDQYLKITEKPLLQLEIPKINLKKDVYNKDSELNNISKNVTLLKESTLPDRKYHHLFLVAHSGTSKISYFRSLINLEENDLVKIYYQDKIYNYKVYEILKLPKLEYIEVEKNLEEKLLTLVTCIGHENRLIINLKLDSIE